MTSTVLASTIGEPFSTADEIGQFPSPVEKDIFSPQEDLLLVHDRKLPPSPFGRLGRFDGLPAFFLLGQRDLSQRLEGRRIHRGELL